MCIRDRVKPSPNLPNDQAIALYPSLCPFEGTAISVGRGTLYPFQVIGSPDIRISSFSFRPEALEGFDKNPMYKNQYCYGNNLRHITAPKGFSLKYIITYYQAYQDLGKADKFFTRPQWFDLLIGNRTAVSYTHLDVYKRQFPSRFTRIFGSLIRPIQVGNLIHKITGMISHIIPVTQDTHLFISNDITQAFSFLNAAYPNQRVGFWIPYLLTPLTVVHIPVKRQLLHHILHKRSISGDIPRPVLPVSYTHLDVYKRQS